MSQRKAEKDKRFTVPDSPKQKSSPVKLRSQEELRSPVGEKAGIIKYDKLSRASSDMQHRFKGYQDAVTKRIANITSAPFPKKPILKH